MQAETGVGQALLAAAKGDTSYLGNSLFPRTTPVSSVIHGVLALQDTAHTRRHILHICLSTMIRTVNR